MVTNYFDPLKTRPQWKGKRVTPTQLLIHDVGLEGGRLNIQEVLSSTIAPDLSREPATKPEVLPSDTRSTGLERQLLRNLHSAYGWLNDLRLPDGGDDTRLCRWMSVLLRLRLMSQLLTMNKVTSVQSFQNTCKGYRASPFVERADEHSLNPDQGFFWTGRLVRRSRILP